MNRRAGLYTRISLDRSGEGLGVERQDTDCRALAERMGWEIVETYRDNDLSAYSGKRRPGYERMVEDLRSGRINAILAYHPDRLHRNTRELEDLIDVFVDLVESKGTSIATVSAGEYDLSSPTGRGIARIIGAIARMESERNAERSKRKRLDMAQAGQAHGGPRAFGWGKDHVSVIPSEHKALREAAERILEGDKPRDIVIDWRQRGIKTAQGKEWVAQKLMQVLTNDRMAGYRTHKGQRAGKGEWEPVVSDGELIQLRALLTGRKWPKESRVYLLSNIAFCGECGNRLYGKMLSLRGKKLRRYVCVGESVWNPKAGCGKVSIMQERLETHVLKMVQASLSGVQERLRRAPAVDSSLERLEGLQRRREELARAFGEGLISMPELLAAREPIEKGISEALSEVGKKNVRTPDETLSRILNHEPLSILPLEAKRSIIGIVLSRVEVSRSSMPGLFDPDRIRIHWRI